MQAGAQRRAQRQLLAARRLPLRLGDHAGVEHAPQYGELSLARTFGVGYRVGPGRVLRQTGQHRRLGHRKCGHRLAEVGLGGGREPIGTLAEVDLVHVELEDLILVQSALDLHAEQHFLELALGCAAVAQVEVARDLLGDGGGTLEPAAGGGLEQRPRHASPVDAAVAAKARVFDGQHGVLQQAWNLPDGREVAALGAELGDLHAVRRLDPKWLQGLVVRQRVQPRQLRPHELDRHRDRQHGACAQAAHQPQRHARGRFQIAPAQPDTCGQVHR